MTCWLRRQKLRPDDFVIRERRASLFLNLGLRSKALPELRRLEKAVAFAVMAAVRLALDYEQMGLLDDAARLAASVVAEAAENREQIELLARFHERRHMKYDLQADYIALSRLEPNQPDIWSRLAQVQIDCGDAEGGRKSLLRFVALDEQNPDAHRRLAQVDESLHLDREAQQELVKASTRRASGHAGRGRSISGRSRNAGEGGIRSSSGACRYCPG